jgi:hypothetical protein
MCYADEPGIVLRVICSDIAGQRRLDCGSDDYFSAVPTHGSYLALHWNTANSFFLEGAERVPPGPPLNLRATGTAETAIALAWDAPADAAVYRVRLSGFDLASTGAPFAHANRLMCGTAYPFTVEAIDLAGNVSPPVALEVSTRPCPDVEGPGLTVRPATGRRGGVVTLRWSVTDVAETRETVAILRGSRRLAYRQTRFATAGDRSLRWRIPRNAASRLRFCVRSRDVAGNLSRLRCAPIAVRAARRS